MQSPPEPQLAFVFTIKAEIGASLSSGKQAWGERMHIPILGGTVSGPRLNGRILPGGSDWPLIRPDGTSEILATYTIRASDGTPILVRNTGLRVSTPEVLSRLRAGTLVDPSEYYFRTTPRFEAPDGNHAWLNDRLFVASLMPNGAEIGIDVYEIA